MTNQNSLAEKKMRFDADMSRTFTRILNRLDLRTRKTLDIGCGFGEHLIHFGEGSVGITTTVEEVAFGKKNGIRILQGNAELVDESQAIHEKFGAIWANNLFEHLLAPHAFLVRLKNISTADTLLILGVPVIPRIASLMKAKKFRGALASLHVNFFTRESLRLTVERAGWKVAEIRPFVVRNRLVDEFILGPFMPHLYVVALNDPAFRYPDKKLKEWKDDSHYAKLIRIMNG